MDDWATRNGYLLCLLMAKLFPSLSIALQNKKVFMSIKAIISDLDGTLLNNQHRISAYTLNVLKRLKKETNVCFVVATGRPYADVFPTLTDCGLEPDYIITSNGARVHQLLPDGRGVRTDNTRVVIGHNLKPSVVRQILEYAKGLSVLTSPREAVGFIQLKRRKFNTNVYQGPDWWVDEGIEASKEAFHPLFQYTEMKDALYDLPSHNALEDVHEIFFAGGHDDLAVWETHLQKELADALTLTFSHPNILDAVAHGVNKGVAVTEVCGRLGLNVAEVAAFGDGMNDEKMLAVAGHAYVMANANPELAKRLPKAKTTGTNDEDGVAKELEKLFFSSA
ncbi:haloacid dehalogenase-like hydrolase/Sucrose-6F-phosphate phosphohydrolase, putative [Angomonas deanei]|uniref:Haloacid dehalogenase-like hydrolase/Sucrose-6F-phosphate phosphohydrolase, putative n=1 Tax=Angomonas deanei TaxID=59799 RepID=A0A7G2CGE1_9TRYP|nr:haloacid dehalogenase-like hydrolase/Sucrose-6F-phosphate phosphohydrolase, putative [Angomonas deanei]